MNLCANCLLKCNGRNVDVGPGQGSQRDPYRNHVLLCEDCAHALIEGDFVSLASRFSETRQVTRE